APGAHPRGPAHRFPAPAQHPAGHQPPVHAPEAPLPGAAQPRRGPATAAPDAARPARRRRKNPTYSQTANCPMTDTNDLFDIPLFDDEPALPPRLRHEDAGIRRIALIELADLGEPDALPIFIDALRNDSDASVRAEAAALLEG